MKMYFCKVIKYQIQQQNLTTWVQNNKWDGKKFKAGNSPGQM